MRKEIKVYKKNKKAFLAFLTMICLVISLCSCGISASDFVGTWRGSTKAGDSCELIVKSNGTYILEADKYTRTGDWEKIESNYYILKYDGIFGASTVKCRKSGETLYLDAEKVFTWESAELKKQ